jgi:hypothetical protein
MYSQRAIFSFLGACILTPFAVISALVEAGAGHGSYFVAKLFFPYTMLSTHLFEIITTPFILLALVQFPFYGLLLAYGAWKQRYCLFIS